MATLLESTVNGINFGRGAGAVSSNTRFGKGALQSNTSGDKNTAVGAYALGAIDSGGCVTGIGYLSLANTSSTTARTVAIGHTSGRYTNGSDIVALGKGAGRSIGGNSVAIGQHAGCNSSGTNGVFIGTSAGEGMGGNSVVIGYYAGLYSTATDAVVVGAFAGQFNTFQANTTLAGHYTGRFLGNAMDNTHVSYYGYQHGGYGQNGSTSWGRYVNNVCNCIYVAWSNVSDCRDKTNFTPITNLGLNFIRKLRPVKYVWDNRQKYVTKCNFEYGIKDGTLKQDKVHYGFLAQEMEFAAKAVGEKFDGITYDSFRDKYTVSYLELVASLVKSVQEINDELDLIENKLVP